jgi:hypothetical protein
MTFFYKTTSWSGGSSVNQETINFWKHLAAKANWRIVQLPNGYFQTEYKHPEEEDWIDVTRRETIDAAERAIDASIEHYGKKVELSKGPVVVKTFK